MTTQTTFATLPHHALAESTSNPRKQFEPIALRELADSIAQSGIHQALLVRPLPGDRLADTYYVPKGQQVKVGSLREGCAIYREKYLGKQGMVTALPGPELEAYEVTFKGRTGGVADFTADELEAA